MEKLKDQIKKAIYYISETLINFFWKDGESFPFENMSYSKKVHLQNISHITHNASHPITHLSKSLRLLDY